MSSQYLSNEENLADLEAQMLEADRPAYDEFKHLRIESGFIDRIFVVYRPTGLTEQNTHRDPEILTQVRVVDFTATARFGCSLTLEDMGTGQVQTVGHVPERLFHYNVFVAVPPFHRLRWDARPYKGAVKRSLAFGVMVKQKTRSDHYSMGVTMLETPSGFQALYPDYQINLQYR